MNHPRRPTPRLKRRYTSIDQAARLTNTPPSVMTPLIPPRPPRFKRKPINEDDEDFGHYVTYCEKYWGHAEDYGPSKWPLADKFINDHKDTWKMQAERDKVQGHAEGDTTEHEDLGRDRSPEDEMDVSEDGVSSMSSSTVRMKNSAMSTDYHESCRLLYAEPSSRKKPILIRAEYSQIYDRLMSMHSSHGGGHHKAVITGQPGIGNLPLHRLIRS